MQPFYSVSSVEEIIIVSDLLIKTNHYTTLAICLKDVNLLRRPEVNFIEY